ncbi:MAG: pilus assembly protein [Planctomycetaceae bacterium]|nr:pilus assembly protein [Planctomycetaceae bacterium]
MCRITPDQAKSPHRCGVTAVELVLVIPVFLTVVCGIVEFGRAMMVGQLVTNAARLGAEQATQPGVDPAAVGASVRQYLQEKAGVPTQRVCVFVDDVQMPPGVPLRALKNRPAKSCAVTVAVNYDDVAYLAGRFLTGTQLTGTCSLPLDSPVSR